MARHQDYHSRGKEAIVHVNEWLDRQLIAIIIEDAMAQHARGSANKFAIRRSRRVTLHHVDIFSLPVNKGDVEEVTL